ncbi:MAG: glucose-1-phosphate thymidylyltransferase [Ginsengibacter sp.]
MAKIFFTENFYQKGMLYPFDRIRSLQDIRIGILTIGEKWEMMQSLFPKNTRHVILNLPVNLVPSPGFWNDVENQKCDFSSANENFRILTSAHQIFEFNEWAIRQDFNLLTAGRLSQKIPFSNKVICPENIFIEVGAVVEHCTLNAAEGPIYIGRDALVMEGCLVRGPFALCQGARLKMGTKIYGATTIGPYCIAGGEIKNSVIFGFSNKAHDGYLGDSVIGEWCNLGAGTSNSNIKNTAGRIKVWNHLTREFELAGTKCGLLMGDYSYCAINTSFNTGTVTGICCNIFGNSIPPKHIPDFSWGEEKYILSKAIRDIGNWKQLKGRTISTNEVETLSDLYSLK